LDDSNSAFYLCFTFADHLIQSIYPSGSRGQTWPSRALRFTLIYLFSYGLSQAFFTAWPGAHRRVQIPSKRLPHAVLVRYTRDSPTAWSGYKNRKIVPVDKTHLRGISMKLVLRWISTAVVVASAFSVMSSQAFADVKIGVTLSATGPAASLGIPEKNTIALLPKEIAGQKMQYIVLDDATDSTQAVKNTRKLTSEDHVDALIGSTVVPNSLAMIDVASETSTPMISMAAAATIV
jgi:hypothetical protein